MKRQKVRHIFQSIMILIGMGCSKGPDFVKSYGTTVTETRKLENFNAITVGEKFIVYLTQDSSLPQQAVIEYGSNLLEKISTKTSPDGLEIKDNNTTNWVRNTNVRPVVKINVLHLESIVINGAAEVICLDTIHGDKLTITMNSTGKQIMNVLYGQVSGDCRNTGHIVFRGSGCIFAWSCENGSWIDASAMESCDAYITNFTKRDCFVNPENILDAKTFNDGNIYYMRDPKFNSKKFENGKGKVLKF